LEANVLIEALGEFIFAPFALTMTLGAVASAAVAHGETLNGKDGLEAQRHNEALGLELMERAHRQEHMEEVLTWTTC